MPATVSYICQPQYPLKKAIEPPISVSHIIPSLLNRTGVALKKLVKMRLLDYSIDWPRLVPFLVNNEKELSRVPLNSEIKPVTRPPSYPNIIVTLLIISFTFPVLMLCNPGWRPANVTSFISLHALNYEFRNRSEQDDSVS